MFRKTRIEYWRQTVLAFSTSAIVLLSACGGSDKASTSRSPTVDNTPNLKLELPASLTGGQQNSPAPAPGFASVASAKNTAGTGEPCGFIGDDGEDHFQNGYKITKFMVSAIATWSCIGDLLIDVSNFVEHDGVIHATDNDNSSPNYDPEDATHYSVTDDSDSQTTVRLYYDYSRDNPPQVGEDPQFYISWHESADDVLQGKIVIDARTINKPNRKADDPVQMRMDFNYSSTEKTADMFLRFDESNPWADGFRIHLVKEMDANPLQKVYLARGLIEMKAQFLPADGISEIPDIRFYTVSNRAGDGAAIAEFQDVSLPLKLSGGIIDNHLGNYLFSKSDTYFFDANSNWDWIYKTVSTAEFRGGRTTPASGGTWIPFDPSLDLIIAAFQLDTDYFTGSKCANIGDDCAPLLNSIFNHDEDFGGQEFNQGSDPMDWRSEAIASPAYLESVYPNGMNWNNAFEFSFTPSN